jgi:hypothetical protein
MNFSELFIRRPIMTLLLTISIREIVGQSYQSIPLGNLVL